MRLTAKTFFCVTAIVLGVVPSTACRDVGFSFLDALPATAQQEQVIAKVELIELLREPWAITDDWKDTGRVRVRVVEAIKGVHEGQVFIVEGRYAFCDQAFPRDEPRFEAHMKNWRPYVAGQFEKTDAGEPVFRGMWLGDRSTNKMGRQ
jgi:hypothetical protein